MQVTPLSPALGAEITGVDTTNISDNEFSRLRQAGMMPVDCWLYVISNLNLISKLRLLVDSAHCLVRTINFRNRY